jgi:hypothetical protein
MADGDVFRGYAFIVGAMKCGTSTLHYLLCQHPSIAEGKKKELNYFSRWQAKRPGRYEEKAFPELDKSRHVYTLDSSPNYTKALRSPQIPGRIAALPGHKRLIYIMRNPVERIESHLTHSSTRERDVDGHLIEVALDTSRYARQLDAFAAEGLLEDMLLLDFDDLVADPQGVAHRVFDFLELPQVPVTLDKPHNVRRTDVKYTSSEDDKRYAELLRDDVRQLIERYKFEPARKWGLA